jgi:hypothetical protein
MIAQRVLPASVVFLLTLLIGSLSVSSAAEEGTAPTPQALTTGDPDIPVEETIKKC